MTEVDHQRFILTRRGYLFVGGLAAIGAGAAFAPTAMIAWSIAGAAVALAMGVDTWRLGSEPDPDVIREAPDSVAIGIWTDISVEIRADWDRPVTMELHDTPPGHFDTKGLPAEATLEPLDSAASPRRASDAKARLRTTYELKAVERGAHEFGPVHLRMHGPLGLVRRQVRCEVAQPLRVYPDFKTVARYTLLAVANRQRDAGIRDVRQRGTGMEFSHLREYRQGDLSRQLDWKATARRQQLISREYEDEQNQRIVCLLDAGRRMRSRDADLSHFDRSLNATLMLAHVALRQGDGVGVGTFGGTDVWVSPQRTSRGIHAIMDALYDVQPTTAPSDLRKAAERLVARQKRRALVVIMTNLYDQLTDELREALELLRQRHLVLVASLREAEIDATLDGPVDGIEDALLTCSTHRYLESRRKVHRTITNRGGLVMDTAPDDLSVRLVNRYLSIKRAGSL